MELVSSALSTGAVLSSSTKFTNSTSSPNSPINNTGAAGSKKIGSGSKAFGCQCKNFKEKEDWMHDLEAAIAISQLRYSLSGKSCKATNLYQNSLHHQGNNIPNQSMNPDHSNNKSFSSSPGPFPAPFSYTSGNLPSTSSATNASMSANEKLSKVLLSASSAGLFNQQYKNKGFSSPSFPNNNSDSGNDGGGVS